MAYKYRLIRDFDVLMESGSEADLQVLSAKARMFKWAMTNDRVPFVKVDPFKLFHHARLVRQGRSNLYFLVNFGGKGGRCACEFGWPCIRSPPLQSWP
jgi:hypothetical protein